MFAGLRATYESLRETGALDRFEGIRDADVILVMENGSIVEQPAEVDPLAALGGGSALGGWFGLFAPPPQPASVMNSAIAARNTAPTEWASAPCTNPRSGCSSLWMSAEIEVTPDNRPGYWEDRGYPLNGIIGE